MNNVFSFRIDQGLRLHDCLNVKNGVSKVILVTHKALVPLFDFEQKVDILSIRPFSDPKEW